MTVYFVTEKGNPSGPVKIGVTADLATRLSGLQTAAHVELEIVASIRGGREVESYFHEALEAYRIRGEWFDRLPEVESTIRRVALFGEACLPFRPDRFPRAEIEARLAEIPPDTRDLTGTLLGDPLPGRSTLAARGGYHTRS